MLLIVILTMVEISVYIFNVLIFGRALKSRFIFFNVYRCSLKVYIVMDTKYNIREYYNSVRIGNHIYPNTMQNVVFSSLIKAVNLVAAHPQNSKIKIIKV